jgi:hypothetical protein
MHQQLHGADAAEGDLSVGRSNGVLHIGLGVGCKGLTWLRKRSVVCCYEHGSRTSVSAEFCKCPK